MKKQGDAPKKGKHMKHSRFSYFFALLSVLALMAGLLGMAQPAQASAPRVADLWVTDGMVDSTLVSGNTLYIGGAFRYVGPPTGSFAALDASGAPDLTFPPVEGSVHAIAPDGNGGWYLGGFFTHVGGHPCNNLVHIKADHSLDLTWNPNPNNTVFTLAVVPPVAGVSTGTVYVGGYFTAIGGQSRSYIAALDASSGLATAWDPNADNDVRVLTLNGDTVYAGGIFSHIGGQPRNQIAALDASTGLATAWNPNAHEAAVYTLAVSGNTIYAGGTFYTIGGQFRACIAALDANTGLATDWNPNANGTVRALIVDGSTIYIGGEFVNAGGQPRRYIAALDAGTGLATDWNPDADNTLAALAVAPPIPGIRDTPILYAAGAFHSIGGQPRNHIAALDASSGLATAWDPNANDSVGALAAVPPIPGGSSNTVYAGGDFNSIGGQSRANIAALDLNTGRATTWNPKTNGRVYTLGISGNTIYAGGLFSRAGGQPRNRLAALDASTGLATDWNPNADSDVFVLRVAPPVLGVAPPISGVAPPISGVAPPISGVAPPIAEGSSGTIYVGGDFSTVGGQPRPGFAALDASTGLATWDPQANGRVYALALSGSTVYAGGEFTAIGGQPRNHIAALDASTGLATAWDPNAGDLVATLVVNGGTVYAGGDFTTIGGQARARAAALDAGTGLATGWDPQADGRVYDLVTNGSTVYAAGIFTSIGGQPRGYIAALDAATGLATNWNPQVDHRVYSLAVVPPISGGVPASTIYAGADYSLSTGRYNGLFALRDGALTCQTAASGGSWRASNWSNCGGTLPGAGDAVSVQAGHTLTVYGNLAVNDLTIAADGELALPLGSNLSVEGTLTHNGRLTQTLAVPASVTTTFLNLKNAAGTVNKFFGITLAPAGNMGNTRVTIAGNQNCSAVPGDELVKRCFEIDPTTPRAATARFYYRFAELNGLLDNRLNLWHPNPAWTLGGFTARRSATCAAGQQDCWVEAFHVSNYGPFVLANRAYPVLFVPVTRK
jgi:hypothetical protein